MKKPKVYTTYISADTKRLLEMTSDKLKLPQRTITELALRLYASRHGVRD